jgi:hypothetical protein
MRPRTAFRLRSGPPFWAGVICVAALAALNFFYFAGHRVLADDAFINFRYADNFLAGHGFNWNRDGERVEGYTSFLYLLVITLLRAAGAEPVKATVVLNGLLFVALTLAVVPTGVRAAGGKTPAALFAPAVVATGHPLVYLARSGMEATLAALLLVLAIECTLRAPRDRAGRALAAGTLFGCAALARPEVALLVAGVLVWSAARNRREGVGLIGRRELLVAAGALLLIGAQLAVRRAYYGDWLPNTYYAKVGGPVPARLLRGLEGSLSLLATAWGAVLQAGLALWVLRRPAPEGVLLGLCTALSALNLLVVGADDWKILWHAALFDISAALLVGQAFSRELGRAGLPPTTYARSVAAGIVVLGMTAIWLFTRIWPPSGAPEFRLSATLAGPVLMVSVAYWVWSRRPSPRRSPVGAERRGPRLGVARSLLAAISLLAPLSVPAVERWMAYPPPRSAEFPLVGQALAGVVRPGDSLAVGAAGAIPYYSRLTTYDTLGLNDRHIARQPMPQRHIAFGHNRGDGPYILSRRPTYLLAVPFLTPAPDPGAGFEKSFREIFAMPEFRRDYQFRPIRVQGGYVNLHRRNDSAPSLGFR